jgi:mutator protein MutT
MQPELPPDSQIPAAPSVTEPAPPLEAALVVAWTGVGGDRRLLVTRRQPGKRFAGLWEWPGGKVEPGEHPCEAACRELAEETGLRARAHELALLAAHRDAGPPAIRFSVFTVELPNRPPPACLGCSDARWLPVDEALALAFPPANGAINRLIAAWAREAPSAPSARRPPADR